MEKEKKASLKGFLGTSGNRITEECIGQSKTGKWIYRRCWVTSDGRIVHSEEVEEEQPITP